MVNRLRSFRVYAKSMIKTLKNGARILSRSETPPVQRLVNKAILRGLKS
jgi:hypothetical protein